MNITANLKQIHNEISIAEKQYLRDEGSVCLLAVSKTRTTDEIMIAFNAGQRHFGENYCQEAIKKIEFIKLPEIVWHFIGSVQSNKTSQIAQYFNWVHTIDRIKIAQRLNESRSENTPLLNICVQINISGEASKSGIAINDTEDFINELKQFKRLKVRGLMALPAPSDDVDKQKVAFSQLNKKMSDLSLTNPELDTLSIGTSKDMSAAIAEGATIVRIGTAIFVSCNARNPAN